MLNLDNYDRKNGIYGFTGEYRFLSNFYPCDHMGIYKSSEHYYMSHKPEPEDTEAISRILNADTPGKAKRVGRSIKLRSDWESIKLRIMTEALQKKFEGGNLRQMLLDTKNRYLEETNHWETLTGVYVRV